eukprot:12790686-Alexandrium_andersonii.AAC.1
MEVCVGADAAVMWPGITAALESVLRDPEPHFGAVQWPRNFMIFAAVSATANECGVADMARAASHVSE